ncbi:hypothetical protein RhiirC2_781014 [Rhizophagus irregularis]|uniref:CCHC-type domain-containing protein n=1 Tax=Rhizophagus irregularis TaxID=588596 RepID=A0A2N1N6F9_9GLOM|nr:hypothetical protein RhiirC2_781014 [Rhizophagus irregularis]
MVRLAYPTLPEANQNELVRQQFLNGLSCENQMEARRIGLENSVASILNKLEEIERYKTDTAPASISTHTPIVTYQGPTLADIENLINSKIPITTARSSAVPVPSSSPFSSPQNDTSFQRLLALAYKLGLPRDVDISKVTLSDLEIFIDTELNKKLPPDHIYHGNQVFGMSSDTRKPKKSKKCSSCGKSGHTKSSCPKSKKGKRKTNYAHDSSDSSNSSDASDSSDSSDSDSDSGHACYGLKKKPTERKRVDKKPTDKKKSQLERQRIIFEVFIQLLKLLVQSFISAVPKETIISTYNALNAEFINYKEPVLNQFKGEPSIKIREKVWDNVKDLFTSILHPMISVVTNSMAANLIRVPWIDRANVILDFQNWQLTIPLSSRKKITIPISLHKRKTNVTSLQMDTIDLKKFALSRKINLSSMWSKF